MRLNLRPVTQREAFPFIQHHHRHHDVPQGWLWGHGVEDEDGRLVGVAVVGRPVARMLDEGYTCEVTRLCTLGTGNACSALYSAAWRAAQAKGYRRILTYILSGETGESLENAGWDFLWRTGGGSWDRKRRPRVDKHSTEPKQAWGKGAWRELTEQRQVAVAAGE